MLVTKIWPDLVWYTFPRSERSGGSTSHEIFCPELALLVSGTLTKQIGVALSVDDFSSFIEGLFVSSGDRVSFLFFRDETLGFGRFKEDIFLGGASLSEMTFSNHKNNQLHENVDTSYLKIRIAKVTRYYQIPKNSTEMNWVFNPGPKYFSKEKWS